MSELFADSRRREAVLGYSQVCATFGNIMIAGAYYAAVTWGDQLPALYGAHHDIVNLTRFGQAANVSTNVVGPICESSDFLGHDRLLPECQSGDVLLIATAGAYGRAMSSNYNLRAPAEEVLLG